MVGLDWERWRGYIDGKAALWGVAALVAVTGAAAIREKLCLFGKRIHGECTDDEILAGQVEPFAGIAGTVLNPDTGKDERVLWDDLRSREDEFRAIEREAYQVLRLSVKEEILDSIDK